MRGVSSERYGVGTVSRLQLSFRRDDTLDTENIGDFLYGAGTVTDAQGKVMSRSFRRPALEKCTDIGLEVPVGVRVACRRNRSPEGFALCNDEFEAAVAGRIDAEHGNRALFYVKFDARSRAGFAVIF